MTERNNTALRILTTMLAGGLTGWFWSQDLLHCSIGVGTGILVGVFTPWLLFHIKSGISWFMEQFERF